MKGENGCNFQHLALVHDFISEAYQVTSIDAIDHPYSFRN